jgi:Bacteriophage Lambda NinG protein
MPRCKYHKTKFEKKYAFQQYCLSDDECIKAFSESVKEKRQKQIEKNQKDLENAKKERTEERKLKADLVNTKVQVHSYIRERDKNKPCISCGCQWNETFEAGHHYSANSFITLKYNLDNIHGQCFYCNNRLEGNFENYALNLPNRIGKERYNKLVELASVDKQFSKIWDIEKLKEIRDNVKKLRKEL